MEKLKLALDWTPNTNHTGFFVAQQKGLYHNKGLEVELIGPEADNYAVTPAKKVELGQADFALCPFESVISYRTKARPFAVKAIAALLREDLSAIVTLKSSGLEHPRQLDGKTYASYKARYEDEIVKQMIRNDGGSGNVNIVWPQKLGIWDTITKKEYDATWVFMNWEGVAASGQHLELNAFRMKDYGIPYGYSPVLLASEAKIAECKEACRKFLQASKAGFLHAQQHPEEAAELLKPFVPEHESHINLPESQRVTGAYYGTEANWGSMEPEKVNEYLDWLYQHHLETVKLTAEEVMTNSLLPASPGN